MITNTMIDKITDNHIFSFEISDDILARGNVGKLEAKLRNLIMNGTVNVQDKFAFLGQIQRRLNMDVTSDIGLSFLFVIFTCINSGLICSEDMRLNKL